jgi:hypothetical protein
LVVRLRRARGQERQQLKWLTYVSVVGGVAITVAVFLTDQPVIVAVFWFPAVAVAIGLAIFKYRLYDIDRIINRTLVYGLLTALLGAVYAGAVLGLGQLFGGLGTHPPSWTVAGATLAVAALFQPARRRIQQAVDRRFNRRHYDAAKTIEAFSTRLREHIDLATLSHRAGRRDRPHHGADHGVVVATALCARLLGYSAQSRHCLLSGPTGHVSRTAGGHDCPGRFRRRRLTLDRPPDGPSPRSAPVADPGHDDAQAS